MSQERELQKIPFHVYGTNRGRMKRPFCLKFRPSSFSNYEEVMRHISQKAVEKGTHPALVRQMEARLHSISDSLERLKFIGNKKAALIIIPEIAFCYPNPLYIMEGFSRSYSIMAEMAIAVSEGRVGHATGDDAARAEECKSKAEMLISVMGLRQIRFNAATTGPAGVSTYEIPVVIENDLIGFVNFGRAVERGRRNDFRRPRPIKLVRLEPRFKYELTIDYVVGEMLSAAEKGNAALAKTAFTEIVDSMNLFHFDGDRKKALCTIAETCMLYENPIHVLESYRDAYSVMAEIAADMKNGRRQPVAWECERKTGEFKDRLMRFTTLSGLVEIRRNAAIATNGSPSTYQIPFITAKQLTDIAVGKTKSYWGTFSR